jgi:isocitrate/isopropylmalate dehydrogenase
MLSGSIGMLGSAALDANGKGLFEPFPRGFSCARRSFQLP